MFPVFLTKHWPLTTFIYGGGGGIRTHVGVISPQVDFESTPLRPLRYPSLKDCFLFSVFRFL
jgi:hypothetical protein